MKKILIQIITLVATSYFLNAQNSVIQSKIRLSKYQFDQLYYSYKLLNSIGRLNLKSLLS